MIMMKTFLIRALVLIGLTASLNAQAQLRVEIFGVGASQIPVAIATFANEAMAPQKISDIIRADLARSGYFKVIDAGAVMSETTSINLSDWKSRGADALVVGSVQRLADGRLDVRYKLIDTIKGVELSAHSILSIPARARVSSHQIADDVFEKLLGVPGVFATRIAYVVKNAANTQFRIEVADADGEDARVALNSNQPIMSPSWSPDGTKIAYVSFEKQKAIVYVQNLVTSQRILVANLKGTNSAPSWSPDGSQLAMTLSASGLGQIYIANADGSGLRRISYSNGIDTEARFSPDGQSLFFTSDRSGGPQIYRMSVTGGEAKRVTFSGDYNISPRIAPDGKTLAYISRRGGKFQLFALDLAQNQELRLTEAGFDESPSFAPNGRYIMYATRAGGRGTLAVVSVDGRIKQSLTTQIGDIQEPTWGPFMK